MQPTGGCVEHWRALALSGKLASFHICILMTSFDLARNGPEVPDGLALALAPLCPSSLGKHHSNISFEPPHRDGAEGSDVVGADALKLCYKYSINVHEGSLTEFGCWGVAIKILLLAVPYQMMDSHSSKVGSASH